jgi:hypothetical protein
MLEKELEIVLQAAARDRVRLASEQDRCLDDIGAVVRHQEAELRFVIRKFASKSVSELVANALASIAALGERQMHEIEQKLAQNELVVEKVRRDCDEAARHAISPTVERERNL